MVKYCDQTDDFFNPLLDAKQIKSIIKELGWNQKEIAAYWGFHENHISRLILNKNGERSLRDDCAFRGLPRKK